MDHNKHDKNSHLLKHSREKNHQHVWENNFKVLGNNYCSNFKRKISEALFIKQLKPSLNVKEKSIQLQLCNWFTIPVASTCLKLTIYTLEQHISCCSWFYHVKFEHVNVYRDITSAVLLKSFVLTFSRSFIHITLIHTLKQLKNQLYFYDVFNK